MDQYVQQLLQKKERSHAIKGINSGLIAGAAWGLEGVLMGMVLGLAPFGGGKNLFLVPLAGACLHDGFAALWLFLYNVVNGKWRDYARTLHTKPGRMIIAAAVLGGPVGMSGNLLAIYFSGPSHTAAITAAYPAIGAVLGSVFLKEKGSARLWAGILLTVAGSFLVGFIPPEGTKPELFYLGIGFAVVAAVGWALEGVISTYGMDLVDSDIAIGIREAASFLVYLAAILPFFRGGGYETIFSALRAGTGWYVAGIALVGGISYLSWYRSMNRIGVGRAMSLNVTYAIWSVFFGWLLNDLHLTVNLILGVLIILSGTLLTIGNPKELASLRNGTEGGHGADSRQV